MNGVAASASGSVGAAVTRLTAPARGCELWLCRLDDDSHNVVAMAASLSAAERARAARFGTELLRRRWMVGRATLRSLLGAKLGIEPHAVELKSGRRGRPQLATPRNLDFNVSHTQGIALIAIADVLSSGTRVGVDIERADRAVNVDGVSRKFMTGRERAFLAALDIDPRRRHFLRLWTCKEAMSKATGDALSAPFRDIDISIHERPALAAGPPPYTPEAWRLYPAEVPPEWIATVAMWQSS
jgi:4'-phosphopantetheinyl transferase